MGAGSSVDPTVQAANLASRILDKQNELDREAVGNVLRRVGRQPSEEDIDAIFFACDPQSTGRISKFDFTEATRGLFRAKNKREQQQALETIARRRGGVPMLPRVSSQPSMGGRRRSRDRGLVSADTPSRSQSMSQSGFNAAMAANEARDTQYAQQQGWATIDEHRRQTARAEGYAELAKREQRYHRDMSNIAEETQINRALTESAYQQQMEDYNRRVKQQQDQHTQAMDKYKRDMAEYEAQCERYRQQEQLAAHYQGAALHNAHHQQHHHNSHAGARAGAFAGAGAGAGHGGGGNFSEDLDEALKLSAATAASEQQQRIMDQNRALQQGRMSSSSSSSPAAHHRGGMGGGGRSGGLHSGSEPLSELEEAIRRSMIDGTGCDSGAGAGAGAGSRGGGAGVGAGAGAAIESDLELALRLSAASAATDNASAMSLNHTHGHGAMSARDGSSSSSSSSNYGVGGGGAHDRAPRGENGRLLHSQSSPVLRNVGMMMSGVPSPRPNGEAGSSGCGCSGCSGGSGGGSGAGSNSSGSGMQEAKLDLEQLWEAFSSKTFEGGEWACKQKLLTTEDFEDCEAFLYLGLPAFTMLDIVLKSSDFADAHRRSSSSSSSSSGCSGSGSGSGGSGTRHGGNGRFNLGNGLQLCRQNCPEAWERYYAAMCKGQAQLQDEQLTEAELAFLRRQVLYASDPDKGKEAELAENAGKVVQPAAGRLAPINRIMGCFIGAATEMTQSRSFKTFDNVLLLLSTT